MTNRTLRDTAMSFIDFETTGLSARSGARVVEVSIVRVEPDGEPQVVLDTLIDPEGPVLCTSIHGIDDEDVLGAPRFTDILGEMIGALENSVVAAFNASFDISFLTAEARLAPNTSKLRTPPYICLMWMRPLLGLSKRCSLEAACHQHGLRAGTHRAAEDALACAYMWKHYLDAAEKAGFGTWARLSTAGSHKYLDTLEWPPYSRRDFVEIGGTTCGTAKKPRSEPIISPIPSLTTDRDTIIDPFLASRAYWRALVEASADGKIDSSEIEGLRRMQRELAVSETIMRDTHARLFADCLRVYAEDGVITDKEAKMLRDAREALQQLGWAPG